MLFGMTWTVIQEKCCSEIFGIGKTSEVFSMKAAGL